MSFNVFDIAASGMHAQRIKMDTVSSNIANVNTTRNEFGEKEAIKLQNSKMYNQNPQSVLMGQSPAQIAFMNSAYNEGFSIDVESDTSEPLGLNGNNVNLESEMMDEAKNGMQYQVVASLLSKSYATMASIIKGQNQ